MADPIAGSSVRITPDLDTFADDLTAKLDEITANASQSINITPDLDDTKLDTDLDALREQVEASGSTIHFTADLQDAAAMQTAADLKVTLDTINAENPKPKVSLDDTAAVAEAEAFSLKIDELGLRNVTAKVNVDTGSSDKEVTDLQGSINFLIISLGELGETLGGGSGGGGGGGGTSSIPAAADAADHSLGALATTAIGLGPALAPVGATLIAGIAGFLPMLVSAGLGVGAFALAAGDDFGGIKTDVESTLAEFQKLEQPMVEPAIGDALKLVIPVFSELSPLVASTSAELVKLEGSASDALQAPFWQGFVSFLGAEAGPAIGAFATVMGGAVKLFAGLSEASEPLIADIEGGLDGIGNRLATWGQEAGTSSGFESFITYVEKEGPVVGALLSGLAGDISGFVTDLAPLGAGVLQVLVPLTTFVKDLEDIHGPLGSNLVDLGALAIAFAYIAPKVKEAEASILAFTVTTQGVEGVAGGSTSALAGLVAGVGGIGPALGIALPILGAAALALVAIKLTSDDAAAASTAFLDGVTTESATTLPQLTQKLDDLTGKLKDLDSQYAAVKTSATDVDVTFSSNSELPRQVGDSYTALTTAISQTKTAIATFNENLTEVETQTGLSKTQVESLASSLNIDLTKALDPAQVRQFTSALQQQEAQTGLTKSALEALAASSKTSTAQIAADVTTATKAATTAWQSYGDAVTNFSSATLPPTAAAIGKFYTDQETQGATFSTNIQKAIQDGYNPQLIESILQAGPAQASQLLQGLVSAQGTGLNNLITQATNALTAEGAQAVEEARLTQEAISSSSSTIAAQLPDALALSQQLTVTNAEAAVQAVATQYNLTLPQVIAIAKQYGIALPDNILANIAGAEAQAAAQASGVTSALGEGLPDVSGVAAALAGAVPAAVNAALPATDASAAGMAYHFTSSITAHTGDASDAGTALGDAVKTGIGGVDLSPAGQAALTQVIGAMTENGSFTTPRQAALNIIGALSAELGSNTGALASAGTALIEGLAAGMAAQSALTAVGDAAGAAVAHAVAAANAAADTHSPSRLFADEVGEPLALGIAAGMTSPASLSALTSAANTIVGHTLNALGGAKGSIGVGLGSTAASSLGGLPSEIASAGIGGSTVVHSAPNININGTGLGAGELQSVINASLRKYSADLVARSHAYGRQRG